MSDVASSPYLAVSTVADLLGVSPSHVYALIRSGELPAIRVGRRGPWRVAAQVVDAFIETCRRHETQRRNWSEATYANVIDLADGSHWLGSR